MSFHFQSVKGFVSVFFIFKKNTIVKKTDEVVNTQKNIFKAFEFVSVVKIL